LTIDFFQIQSIKKLLAKAWIVDILSTENDKKWRNE